MEFLLPKSVKQKIDDFFSSNPIYSLLSGPWTRMFKGHNFILSSPEIFYQVFYVWDIIREKPQEGNSYCEYFADQFIKALEDEYPTADKSDIRFAAAVVMQSLCECFSKTDDSFYINLCAVLRTQMHKIDVSYAYSLHNKFAYAYRRADLTAFSECIASYLNNDDDWYSEDIKNIIENTDAEDIEEEGAQFTNQQLIILFEYLLEESLSPEYTNVQALSAFIARVSGKSPESIRQSIIRRNKKGVNKVDARRVAAALEAFCPEKASDILNELVDNL